MLYISKVKGIVISYENQVITCINPNGSRMWKKGESYKYTAPLNDQWIPITFKAYLKLLK